MKGQFGLINKGKTSKRIDIKNYLAKLHYNKYFSQLNNIQQEKIIKYIEMQKLT